VAGLESGLVTGSHGVALRPDQSLEDALQRDYAMVVLPGGLPGADHLRDDPRVISLLRQMADSGRFTAAICAAPKVLIAAGLLEDRTATSFPGVLTTGQARGLTVTDNAVEQDGKVITSRGPGTAMDFALTLIENLRGRDVRDEVEHRLQRSGQ
jgi:4-methyl-5(b-hydroxyethyl)-thiazole monophosphate biosynthesis